MTAEAASRNATDVTEVGAAAAPDVLAVVHAGFGAREVLDPPSHALEETEASVAAALAEHGGLLATVAGRPTGALLFRPYIDGFGRHLGLRRVAVRPDAQGGGVAKALVRNAEEIALARGCTGVRIAARTELPKTVRFWEHLGYGEIERDGTTLVMAKELPVTVGAATAEDTRELGGRLAGLLRAGDLLLVSGALGAGKTTFAQGLGDGLGVRGPVTSPTFVIARVHPSLCGGLALVHADAYRLGDAGELDDLDLDASLDDAVTLVEWGTGLAEGLTQDRLEVRITRQAGDSNDERRVITLDPVGARWVGSRLHTLA